MTNLYIQSAHGSLEYDQARMFVDLGYKVTGKFDVGGTQRPKIQSVTDNNSDIKDSDIIILHQVPDYTFVMNDHLNQGRKVILVAFGQGDVWQHKKVSEFCASFKNSYVAAYSVKDFEMHKSLGCPENKIKLIRFSKYLSDYKPWKGDWPVCYVSCNSIQRRGAGCGWEMLEKIEKEVPIMLGGRETETTNFGLGQLEYKALPNIYSHVQCHLSLGTVPAPMTLTLIDAFCSGTPVVAYNNGAGIDKENFGIIIENSVEGIINSIRNILSHRDFRNECHVKSKNNAKLFDVKIIGEQWKALIDKVQSN